MRTIGSDHDDSACAIRCIPQEAAELARGQVRSDGAREVTFVCSVSQKQEHALVIGETLAVRLAAEPGVGSPAAGRVLASLSQATLCACDVATVTAQPQSAAQQTLERLGDAGLAAPHAIAGMPYFALTAAGREVLARVLPAPAASSPAAAADSCGCGSCGPRLVLEDD